MLEAEQLMRITRLHLAVLTLLLPIQMMVTQSFLCLLWTAQTTACPHREVYSVLIPTIMERSQYLQALMMLAVVRVIRSLLALQ